MIAVFVTRGEVAYPGSPLVLRTCGGGKDYFSFEGPKKWFGASFLTSRLRSSLAQSRGVWVSLLTGAIHLCGEGAIKEAVDLRLQLAIVEWPRVGNARGSDLGMNMPLPPGCRQR